MEEENEVGESEGLRGSPDCWRQHETRQSSMYTVNSRGGPLLRNLLEVVLLMSVA